MTLTLWAWLRGKEAVNGLLVVQVSCDASPLHSSPAASKSNHGLFIKDFPCLPMTTGDACVTAGMFIVVIVIPIVVFVTITVVVSIVIIITSSSQLLLQSSSYCT